VIKDGNTHKNVLGIQIGGRSVPLHGLCEVMPNCEILVFFM
jgi:hypothetical protein